MKNRLFSLIAVNRLAVILLVIAVSSCAGTMKSSPEKERAKALQRLGTSLYLQGNVREGLAKLLEAEKLDPSNPELQHELALAYQRLDKFDLSLQHFRKAIDLKPDFPDAYNNMGVLYSQRGDWDDALKCFSKAVSYVLYQTPHFAYRNMGLVYFKMKDYGRAIEFYKKALSVSPDYVDAYFDLAKTYEILGENEKAILTYDQIKKQAPESLVPYLAQAELYRKTGRIDESIDNLNYIIGIDPRSHVAREAIKLLEDIQSSR